MHAKTAKCKIKIVKVLFPTVVAKGILLDGIILSTAIVMTMEMQK